MMKGAGLASVKVVEPAGTREDPSMQSHPFVFGEKEGPPGSPTLLLYASYGTVDESAAAAATSSDYRKVTTDDNPTDAQVRE